MSNGIARFPMTAAQAEAVQATCAREQSLPHTFSLDLGEGVELELLLVPPSEFLMGLSEDAFELYTSWEPHDDVWSDNPLLLHRVRIDIPSYIGRTVVTQAQWWAVMGSNPSHFKADGALPVETISARGGRTSEAVICRKVGCAVLVQWPRPHSNYSPVAGQGYGAEPS